MEVSRADGTAEAGSSSQVEAVAEAPKRLKRPVKPDKESHQTAVQTLQDELQNRRNKADELQTRIQAKRQSGGSPEIMEARNKASALQSSWRAEAGKRNALKEQATNLDGERNSLRAAIRDQKTKLGAFSTVQKIDERVRALEYRLTHTTLDLKDENRAREEMKRTAALKPLAAQYMENQEKLKKSDKERERLQEERRQLEEKINGIKAQEEQQKAVLNDLREKDAAKTQDLPSLMKEKDECWEVHNAIRNKIQQMRDEFKEKNNVFWVESQAWREQQKQDKAERDALREKEYRTKQAERQAQAAEFAGEPYHKEVGLCDQLLIHLAKYKPQAQPSKSTVASTAKDSSAPFEGMKAVTKSNKDEDDFGAFMGSAVKKGKGAKKAAKQTNASQLQGASKQKLNHSIDMIDAFSKLKIMMPTTIDEVPTAVEEVESSKAYWLKKRQEAKQSGILPEETSSSAANGVPKTPKVAKTMVPATFQLDALEWAGLDGNVKPVSSPETSPEKATEEDIVEAKEADVKPQVDKDEGVKDVAEAAVAEHSNQPSTAETKSAVHVEHSTDLEPKADNVIAEKESEGTASKIEEVPAQKVAIDMNTTDDKEAVDVE